VEYVRSVSLIAMIYLEIEIAQSESFVRVICNFLGLKIEEILRRRQTGKRERERERDRAS
jgi:hypothetical protein